MMEPDLLNELTWWVDLGVLPLFIAMEIYWFIRMRRRPGEIVNLMIYFFIYNLPFILLAISMMFQPVPGVWLGGVRLIALLILVISNIRLHVLNDKSGEDLGVLHTYFLLISVPVIVVLEICVRFIG